MSETQESSFLETVLLKPEIIVAVDQSVLSASATKHRLLICGSRDYTNREEFDSVVDKWINDNGMPSVIYSGLSKGADTLAHQYAIKRDIRFQGFIANWSRFKKAAGPIRNAQMIAECTHVLAFPKREDSGVDCSQSWKTKSPGTRDAINKAIAAGKSPTIHEVD